MHKFSKAIILIAPLSLSAAFSVNAEIIAHYPLDSNANDYSASANHGEINGETVTWANSPVSSLGNSIDLGGNDYVACPPNANLDLEQQTISFWFKMDQSTTRILLNRGRPHNNGWQIAVNTNGMTISYNNSDPNNDNTKSARLTGGISQDTWYHMTIAIDKSIGEYGQITSYLNGEKQYTHEMPVAMSYSENQSLYIGAKNQFGTKFDGQIDDIRIYDEILSEDQIASIANNENNIDIDDAVELADLVAKNTQDITNNAASITNNKSTIDTNTASINTASDAIATNGVNIANNAASITANASAINNVSTSITENSEKISANFTAIAENKNAISALATDNDSKIAANASDIQDVFGEVDANLDVIASNSDRITTLEQTDYFSPTIINASDYYPAGYTQFVYQHTLGDNVTEIVMTAEASSDEIGPTGVWSFSFDGYDSNGNISNSFKYRNTYRTNEKGLHLVSRTFQHNDGPISEKKYSPEIVMLKNGSMIGSYFGNYISQTTSSDPNIEEQKISYTSRVLPLAVQSVTVDQTTYDNCLVLETIKAPFTRTEFRCPGVGLVKAIETGDDGEITSTLELKSYQ